MCSTSMRVSVAICTFGTMLEIVPFFADDFRPMKDFPPSENEAPGDEIKLPSRAAVLVAVSELPIDLAVEIDFDGFVVCGMH